MEKEKFKADLNIIHFLKEDLDKFNRKKKKNNFFINYGGNVIDSLFDLGDLDFNFSDSKNRYCVRQRTLNHNFLDRIKSLFKKKEVIYEIFIEDK